MVMQLTKLQGSVEAGETRRYPHPFDRKVSGNARLRGPPPPVDIAIRRTCLSWLRRVGVPPADPRHPYCAPPHCPEVLQGSCQGTGQHSVEAQQSIHVGVPGRPWPLTACQTFFPGLRQPWKYL
jgi:hypothetical protein